MKIKAELVLELEDAFKKWEMLLEQQRRNITKDIQKLLNDTSHNTEFLTVKEVLSLLRIGKGALYAIINKGALPTVKIGGKRLFQKADIEKYLTEITKL